MQKQTAYLIGILIIIFSVIGYIYVNKLYIGPGSDFENERGHFAGLLHAEIPEKCNAHWNDVCQLFDCMVDRCWCDDSSPESAILYEGEADLRDKQDVEVYFSQTEDYKDLEITGIAKLNNIFYNVFAEDEIGYEEVFTVAADGTILKTICGV